MRSSLKEVIMRRRCRMDGKHSERVSGMGGDEVRGFGMG